MDVNPDLIHQYLAKLEADMNVAHAAFMETKARLEPSGDHEGIRDAWAKFQATIEPMQAERTAILLRLARVKEAQPLTISIALNDLEYAAGSES